MDNTLNFILNQITENNNSCCVRVIRSVVGNWVGKEYTDFSLVNIFKNVKLLSNNTVVYLVPVSFRGTIVEYVTSERE